MKKILIAGIAMLTVAISSCDEDTTTLGYSLTADIDRVTLSETTFNVDTRSIAANPDSVLARTEYSYLGRIKDPETRTYISSDFSTQFAVLENETDYIFAPKDSIINRDSIGNPEAVSCALNIIVESFLGDSLTAMKLTAMELDKPIEENRLYFSSFDPQEQGYIRPAADGGLQQNKFYSLTDLQLSDSARNARNNSDYYNYVSIPLNSPYQDKEGKHYNNYGSYLLRTYYEHPEYFRNSITFANHVCPGFYIKTTDGLGLMVKVLNTQLEVSYLYREDTVSYVGHKTFYGTEEVLQTTHVANNQTQIDSLARETRWTYLKTPSGIFTEVTLPIDDIMKGHERDTISLAEIIFHRMNDDNELSETMLETPTNLLMVERDSMYTFFINGNMTDNNTSYLATFDESANTYAFNNISSLVSHMYTKRNSGSPNWNKVVLIPVQTSTTSSSSSYYSTSTTITGINNEMSISSVRLVGGSNNEHQPVQLRVIYNVGE